MEDEIPEGSMKEIYEEDAAGYARYVNLLMTGLDEPMCFCDGMSGLIDGGLPQARVNETGIQTLPPRRTTKPQYINNEKVQPVRVKQYS